MIKKCLETIILSICFIHVYSIVHRVMFLVNVLAVPSKGFVNEGATL